MEAMAVVVVLWPQLPYGDILEVLVVVPSPPMAAAVAVFLEMVPLHQLALVVVVVAVVVGLQLTAVLVVLSLDSFSNHRRFNYVY